MDKKPISSAITFPDAALVRKPESIERTVDRICRSPQQVERLLRSENQTAALEHPNPRIRTCVLRNIEMNEPNYSVRMCLLGAAVNGNVKFYLRPVGHEIYLEITRDVWLGHALTSINPISLAMTGLVSLPRSTVPLDDSFPWLCRFHLFLDRDQFEDAIAFKRPPSLAQLKESATAIVEKVRNGDPNGRIVKKEFSNQMSALNPGVSKRSIEKIWKSEIIPVGWKAPGRIPRSTD